MIVLHKFWLIIRFDIELTPVNKHLTHRLCINQLLELGNLKISCLLIDVILVEWSLEITHVFRLRSKLDWRPYQGNSLCLWLTQMTFWIISSILLKNFHVWRSFVFKILITCKDIQCPAQVIRWLHFHIILGFCLLLLDRKTVVVLRKLRYLLLLTRSLLLRCRHW